MITFEEVGTYLIVSQHVEGLGSQQIGEIMKTRGGDFAYVPWSVEKFFVVMSEDELLELFEKVRHMNSEAADEP